MARWAPFPQSRMPASIEEFNKAKCMYELHRTDKLYPVRSSAKVGAGVEKARAELLNRDGSIKDRCIGKVYYIIYDIMNNIIYDIIYDIMNNIICDIAHDIIYDIIYDITYDIINEFSCDFTGGRC